MYNQLFFCCILFIVSCASPAKAQIENNLTNPNFAESNNFSFNTPIVIDTEPEKLTFKPNKIESGTITESGLALGNTTYTMRIQTIDSSTLLSMPQMKIEDEHLYIPNHSISKISKD